MPRKSESFAVRLKRLRKSAGLTQTALATAAGMHWRTIMDYEQGKKDDPRLSSLEALAQALGINAGELADGTGPSRD